MTTGQSGGLEDRSGSGQELDRPGLLDPAVVLVQPLDGSRAGAVDRSSRRVTREQWRFLSRSWAFRVGAALLLLWVGCAIFGGSVAPEDPLTQDLLNANQGPSGAHLFGTDSLGRDVFSRVIAGSRSVLIVAPIATLLGTVLGTILGLVQGYYRGPVDAITGRLVDAFLALPYVILLFLFLVALGSSTATLILIISCFYGIVISRTVRAAVLQEIELDYVAAARLRGEGSLHTMFVEILPNVRPLIIVEFTVRLGYAIFAVATLSYLGFGIQPPTPDWGADIAANAQLLSAGYWWQTLFPALAVASLISAVNMIDDSVAKAVIE